MCQARKIVNGASDAAHAMNMAEFDVMIDKVNREWDVDTTVYTFTDGSKLIVTGDEYSWEAPK